MAQPYSIPHKLGRFIRIDARRRRLLIESTLLLLLARLALALIPFPYLAGRLGRFVPPDDPRVTEARSRFQLHDVEIAEAVGWAVTRAARHLPVRAVCLPQAMAARIMLARRGVASVVHFGAAKSTDKPIDAHAWLDAAGVAVTDYPVLERFAELACFV
jgi:Transglutaminase-like superfamily